VYLYSPTGTLINQMTGVTAFDQIGSGGVTVLSSGDYVVASPTWRKFLPPPVNQTLDNVGAVTKCSASAGCPAQISAANSLTGSNANDLIGGGTGRNAVTALTNGNYVVSSPYWHSSQAVAKVGAVTFCQGATNSCANKEVSGANSLVGSSANDYVGGAATDILGSLLNADIKILANGDYVVSSPNWDKPAPNGFTDAGAVTLCRMTTNSCAGQIVSSANSLTGANQGDNVGKSGSVALANGNYVVVSALWDISASITDVGAVTFCNAAVNGCASQQVSGANSLIGSKSGDRIGTAANEFIVSVAALSNGNYIIRSPYWDNGSAGDCRR
jgi:hypothetical protein